MSRTFTDHTVWMLSDEIFRTPDTYGELQIKIFWLIDQIIKLLNLLHGNQIWNLPLDFQKSGHKLLIYTVFFHLA